MTQLITDYIKVYKEYTQDEMELIADESGSFDWSPHQWSGGDHTEKFTTRDFQELDVSYPSKAVAKIVNLKNKIVIDNYAREFPFCTSGMQGTTPPRFNRYLENTNMSMHVDHIKTAFDGTRRGIPILSLVTVFNDDYDGGDFVFNDDYTVELKAGDTLVFPSVFMYAHRVETVTKGARLSCVTWAH